jgi:acyl carrier protein
MTTNRDEIRAAITEKILALSPDLGPTSAIDADAHLIERVGLDSIAILETLVWLEERFEVRIPDEDLNVEHFSTIDKMTDYVYASMATA